MEPRISIVTLGVKDLERSVRFYRDGLGLPTDYGSGDVAFFQTSGAQLGLYSRKALAEDATVPSEGQGFRGFTIAHNLRSREEVDAAMTEAEAAGAKIVKPAQDVFWGGYSGYFPILTASSGRSPGTPTSRSTSGLLNKGGVQRGAAPLPGV